MNARSKLETLTTVVPIAEVHNGEIKSVGTAFFVSEAGLLVTARHVIDGMVPEDAPEGRFLGRHSHKFAIVVPSTPSEDPDEVTAIRIQQIALDASVSDVAVLRVDMREFPAALLPYLRPWPLAHVRPKSGEECLVIGYPGQNC